MWAEHLRSQWLVKYIRHDNLLVNTDKYKNMQNTLNIARYHVYLKYPVTKFIARW